MDRKGIYRKGRQGHARNVSAYRMYMQHVKKWRVPVTILVALVLVFGTPLGVGDRAGLFQASLLNADQTAVISQLPRDQAFKALISELKTFINECERFAMPTCTHEGQKLATDLVSSSQNINEAIAVVETFVARYESEVAQLACYFDLAAAEEKLEEAEQLMTTFVDTYGDVMNSEDVEVSLERLERLSTVVGTVVKTCK